MLTVAILLASAAMAVAQPSNGDGAEQAHALRVPMASEGEAVRSEGKAPVRRRESEAPRLLLYRGQGTMKA
ncbi:MAG: hypothetical protein KGN34_08310 [Sphingomonadales bacterium]|nr:hypothetical protein [Sphingomonadales bacterium]